MKKMEDMSKEGGEEERKNEKKEKGAKEGERTAPGWIWCWEDQERKAKEGTSEQREEEAEALSPCLSPDS